MAVLAKGLPVVFIPEQPTVAPVRDDVIHYGRGRQLPFSLTFRAQWMLFQKGLSCFPPPGVIPSGVRAAAHTVRAPHDVILTEHLARHAKAWTAGIPAGPRRSSRHTYHLTSPASACHAHRRYTLMNLRQHSSTCALAHSVRRSPKGVFLIYRSSFTQR